MDLTAPSSSLDIDLILKRENLSPSEARTLWCHWLGFHVRQYCQLNRSYEAVKGKTSPEILAVGRQQMADCRQEFYQYMQLLQALDAWEERGE